MEFKAFKDMDIQRIILGIIFSAIAALVALGYIPGIPIGPIGYAFSLGLYWLGLSTLVNGLFTQRKDLNSINAELKAIRHDLKRLSLKLDKIKRHRMRNSYRSRCREQ